MVFLSQKSSFTWHLVEPLWHPSYPLLFLMQRYRFPSKLVALFLALAELQAKPKGVQLSFPRYLYAVAILPERNWVASNFGRAMSY
jgi:hypothetical protein